MPVISNGASNAIIDGRSEYRLRRVIQSPGDVFELDASPLALYVGPDSDVADIKVTYPDKRSAVQWSELVVSPDGPWVQRIVSNPIQEDGLTGLPLVPLVSPVDIVKADYERPAASPNIPTRRFTLDVVLDLIAVLTPNFNGSIPSVRSDKVFRLPNVPFATTGVFPENGDTDIVFPVYGRRLVSVHIVAGSGVGFNCQFHTVSLQPGTNTEARLLGQITRAPISIQTTTAGVVRMGNDVQFWTDSATPSTISPTPNIAAGPHGQVDLMVLTISDNGSPAGDVFVDVIIRVSDREEG